MGDLQSYRRRPIARIVCYGADADGAAIAFSHPPAATTRAAASAAAANDSNRHVEGCVKGEARVASPVDVALPVALHSALEAIASERQRELEGGDAAAASSGLTAEALGDALCEYVTGAAGVVDCLRQAGAVRVLE